MTVKIWKRQLSYYGQSGVSRSSSGTGYGSGRIGVTFHCCHVSI